MSRSCQRATFSSPTTAFARTTRARPQMRSAVIGLRLCGIAEEPFCARPNGSSTSRTSVRARCRISVAKRSRTRRRSPARTTARHAGPVAGSASTTAPARDRAARTRSAPPPDQWPNRYRPPRELADPHPLERALHPHPVAVERERPPGELEAERRRLRMNAVSAADHRCRAMLLRAGHHDAKRPVDSLEHEHAGLLHGERQRRVEHVRRCQTVVEPAPLRAERLGDGIDERGDVMLCLALELGDPLDRGRRAPRRGSARRPRPG